MTIVIILVELVNDLNMYAKVTRCLLGNNILGKDH